MTGTVGSTLGATVDGITGSHGDPLTAATGAGEVDATRRRRRAWSRRVLALDLVSVAAVSGLGAVFAAGPADALLLALAPVLLLGAAFAVTRCWHPLTVSGGGPEYRAVVRAGVGALLVLALTDVALEGSALRPVVLAVVPVAVLAVLAGRVTARAALHRRHRRGVGLTRVLAVGTAEAVVGLVERTRRAPEHGWTVVAACAPATAGRCADVPIVGGLEDVADQVDRVAAEVVAVAPAPGWSPERLRRLAWRLEGTGRDLVVDPGLMEIAGPRLQVTPVDGLPMLRVLRSRRGGTAAAAMGVADRVVAAAALTALAVLAPVLALVAAAVRLDGGGPVLARCERLGRGGVRFTMLTLAPAGDRAGRVRALLRRCSLDVLPPLVNVLRGSMALVGPRPRPPAATGDPAGDGATSSDDRRLLVRPGITGLWRIADRPAGVGRGTDAAETARLDLRYVETWTPGLDLVILARTAARIVTGRASRDRW